MMIDAELGRDERLEQAWPLLRQDIGVFETVPVLAIVLARVAALRGRTDDAAAELDRLAGDDFASLRRDMMFSAAVALLGELAAFLDRKEAADQLYGMLLSYQRRTVTLGPYACFGAVARFLGLLAALGGRSDDALEHLREALALNARMGARTWEAYCHRDIGTILGKRGRAGDQELASDHLSKARSLAERLGMKRLLMSLEQREAPLSTASRETHRVRPPEKGAFKRRGDHWVVGLGPRTTVVRDLKGLHYIARLLAEPGRELHAVDLAGAAGVGGAAGARALGGELGPVFDERARAAYRRRLADLTQELHEAQEWSDLERAARAQAEIDALTAELAKGTGLGGRERVTGTTAERARVSVTKAIRIAIARIAGADPALGHHLSNSVSTGIFCSYRPESRAAVRWDLDGPNDKDGPGNDVPPPVTPSY